MITTTTTKDLQATITLQPITRIMDMVQAQPAATLEVLAPAWLLAMVAQPAGALEVLAPGWSLPLEVQHSDHTLEVVAPELSLPLVAQPDDNGSVVHLRCTICRETQ